MTAAPHGFRTLKTNFKRAVELDPRNFVVVVEAGSTFSGMRRYAEARRLFEHGAEYPAKQSVRPLSASDSIPSRKTGETARLAKAIGPGCATRSSRPHAASPFRLFFAAGCSGIEPQPKRHSH